MSMNTWQPTGFSAGEFARMQQDAERRVEEMRKLETRPLPPGLDYMDIPVLRIEARQKLDKIRPLNLGQASRISGVSPSDIAALMIWLEKG